MMAAVPAFVLGHVDALTTFSDSDVLSLFLVVDHSCADLVYDRRLIVLQKRNVQI